MKINRTFAAVFAVFAVLGGAAASAHALNMRIFSRVKSKNNNRNIWESEYGDIAYSCEGEGVPLLFIHGIGIGAGSDEWERNIAGLAKNYKVYAIDLPGFGNSEKRKMTYSSYYYVRIINDFIVKVIGKRASVVAAGMSGAIVLAGAKICPKLYNKIIIVNPYSEGMGSKYRENRFVKAVLPLPVIGTLVYNFISSKQSILSFLDYAVPQTENYREVAEIMDKKYQNAHLYGTNNKYAIISLINGYLDANIFSLIKGCSTRLCVIASGGNEVSPFIPVYDGVSVAGIKHGEFYPNIYSSDEFNEFVEEFIKSPAYA